jgi:putative endonuclease
LEERSSRPGREGEDLACRHLERAGFVIVERNYRCRGGELDIVARDGATFVFVEVKDRGGSSHGSAVEAVTREKRRRILRAARLYAATHGLSEAPLRFDVVSIDRGPSGPHIRHDEAAFGEE